MKSGKKHILFITPSLASTGSEVLLFHFINFIAKQYAVSVICFNHGNLISALDKSVKVHSLKIGNPATIPAKIIRRFKIHIALPFLLKRYKKHLWYVNTIILPIPVKYAVDNKIDFCLHVHELKHMYSVLSALQLDFALNKSTRLIANSKITKQHLIEAGSKKEIDVLPPFIDVDLIDSLKVEKETRQSAKTTWVMAGSIDRNKNPLLFIEIARETKKQNLPYNFVWLYNSKSEPDLFSEISAILKKEDLPVNFIQTQNYNDYIRKFSSCDGFLLTSSYESFSMATLEALALGLSLVVNDCGGVAEFLNNNLASIIALGSLPESYLKQMQFELQRAENNKSAKYALAMSFNKPQILENWEKLLH
ncbi:hypothetical protein CNR22_19390 [Sphingobacteriaceae bacterium]|nr:hypothetical protein CNR22_19390 [Sphingobacteriaceae bacterium]